MNVGDKLPEVLGLDENGNEIRLSDFAGRRLVLYFYPRDNTPGCTSEACNLRDNYEALRAQGFEIVGVSADSAESHKKFIAKHQLPFPLVTDSEHTLMDQMGVWGLKTMCGKQYMGINRTTFIVGADGTIERIFGPRQIKVKDHAHQIMTS